MRKLIIFLVALVCHPVFAQNGPGAYGGGYPGATYSGQADMLTDLLFNGAPYVTGAATPNIPTPGRTNSVAVAQNAPNIISPNFIVVGGGSTDGYFNIDGNVFGIHATNYHFIKSPNGNNSLQIGNATDPTNYYKNTTHTFTSADGVTTFAGITSAGITINTNTTPTLTFGTSGNTAGNFAAQGTGGFNFMSGGNQLFAIRSNASPDVNYVQVAGNITLNNPIISAQGSDTDIGLAVSSKGAGNINLYTASVASLQVQISNTASATRFLTLTGSNGGNPTISASAGDVAFGASIATTATDATSTSTGAIKNTGGMSVNKRVFMNGLSADTASTDNTVCHNTSTNEIMTGTGAAGICLGTSSARYKRDIISAHVGLDELLRLRPVNFYYLPGRGGPQLQYGFLAEEVVDVIPSIVGLNRDAEPNSVDMMAMVPILVNAVKELKGEIDRKLDRSSVPQHRARSINRSGNVQ